MERAEIEIGEAFTELCVDNAKKDLLILYENQIQRLDLATKKKTKLITLPESTKRMAISPDGETLAVALPATILFYDLSNLQEGRSSPAKPILEVSGYIQHGPMLFSQNGKWFVGVGGGNAQRGYLVDLEKKNTVNFWPKPEGSYFSVGDRGKVHYFDLMGRAIESEADSNGKLSVFKELKIEPLRAPLASHISPDGTKMIRFNREGCIEVLAFPSGNLIEGNWDPGCINDYEFFRGGSGWAPSGKYFYWVQRNRIVVWESPAN